MCDAHAEYCLETEGIIVSYSCASHAPCPGLATVVCSCLDTAGMNCNSCTDGVDGATLNCGGG
jgi:hypothetical protein